MEIKKMSEMTALPQTSSEIVQSDVMRYKRNKLPANLALLSLVFECLYFMIFYSFNVDTENKFILGLSVAVNLVVLLITFYAEEGIKNYNKKFSIVLLVMAVIQFIRIFYYPIKIFSDDTYTTRFLFHNIGHVEFGIALIIMLILGCACLVAAAVIGYAKSVKYEKLNKAIADGTINVEDALKDLDAQDGAQEVTNA